MDTWDTLQFRPSLLAHFKKQEPKKGISSRWSVSCSWWGKRLHVNYITGHRVRCCVHVLLKQSDAGNLCHNRLVWNFLSAAQTPTRLFLQHDIKKESAAQSMRTIYIYIWNGFHSLPACEEQLCVTTVRAWVFGERVNYGWLGLHDSPGGTWEPHLPLPNYPKICAPAKWILTWPKHCKYTVAFCLTVKVIWRQCSNQLLVQRRSFIEKPRLLWVFYSYLCTRPS